MELFFSDYYLTQRLILKIPLVVVTLIGVIGANNVPSQSIVEDRIAAGVPSQIILEQEIDASSVEKIEKLAFEDGTDVEEKVREYFKDTPVLIRIAKCESTFRHINKNGEVIRGKVNSLDVGVMQINEHYHLKEAKNLGFDIYSLPGNMAYAKYLYDKKGAKPWGSSNPCWK